MKKPKSILFVLQSTFTAGGAFRSFKLLLEGFSGDSSFTVRVIVFSPEKNLVQELEDLEDVEVISLDHLPFGILGRFLDGWPLGSGMQAFSKLSFDVVLSVFSIKKLQEQITKCNPDIVYANSSIFRPSMLWANQGLEKKPAVFIHLRENAQFADGIIRYVFNKIFEALSRLSYICISETIREKVEKFTENKAYLVYNPISVSSAPKPSPVNGIKQSKIKVLFAGGFQPNKGLAEFLLFLNSLSFCNTQVELMVVGGAGPKKYTNRCDELIGKLSDKITVVNAKTVDNIDKWIATSSFCVVWHTHPHFSRFIVEAQLIGKTVLTKSDILIEEHKQLSPMFICDIVPQDYWGTTFENVFATIQRIGDISEKKILDQTFEKTFSADHHVAQVKKILENKIQG